MFVGGTTAYKMGAAAAACVREAKRRGLWAHMGRVNSGSRIKYAKSIGCDSCNGTRISLFTDRWLPLGLHYAGAPTQVGMDA